MITTFEYDISYSAFVHRFRRQGAPLLAIQSSRRSYTDLASALVALCSASVSSPARRRSDASPSVAVTHDSLVSPPNPPNRSQQLPRVLQDHQWPWRYRSSGTAACPRSRKWSRTSSATATGNAVQVRLGHRQRVLRIVADCATPTSSSLLHLPNELLLQILEHLCRDFADNDHGRPTAGPTIDLLLVCRRLYPLAVSLRLRKIRLKGETTDVDSILAYLIRTLGAFEAVHELEVHLNSVVEYDMVLPAILSRLTHLCALRIVDDPDESGDDDDDDLADSWCRIDELLIRCSNLRYLELDPARLVDEVDFATCVRPIRHLAMNAANNSLRAVSFLQNAQPTRLCLHVTASAAPPELAWETLQQLEIEFAPGLAGLPTAFLTTLRNVVSRPACLTSRSSVRARRGVLTEV